MKTRKLTSSTALAALRGSADAGEGFIEVRAAAPMRGQTMYVETPKCLVGQSRHVRNTPSCRRNIPICTKDARPDVRDARRILVSRPVYGPSTCQAFLSPDSLLDEHQQFPHALCVRQFVALVIALLLEDCGHGADITLLKRSPVPGIAIRVAPVKS